jgi:hypothetical protein
MVNKGSKKSGWRMRTRRSKTRRGGEGEEEAEMMSKAADMNKATEGMTMPDFNMTESPEDEEVMDPVIQNGEMPESPDEDQQDEEDMGPDDDEEMAPVIDEITESPEEVEEPQVQLSEDEDEEEEPSVGGKKRRMSLKKSQQKRRQTKRSKKGRKGKKTKRAKRSKTRRRGSRK